MSKVEPGKVSSEAPHLPVMLSVCVCVNVTACVELGAASETSPFNGTHCAIGVVGLPLVAKKLISAELQEEVKSPLTDAELTVTIDPVGMSVDAMSTALDVPLLEMVPVQL